MRQQFFKLIALPALVAMLFTACIKNKNVELGDAGTAMVKISDAPRRTLFYSPFSDVKTIDLFSLRRDEVNSAAMGQPISLKVTASVDSLDAYNDAHGTTYEPLPDSLYSFIGTGATRSGDVYTFDIGSNVPGAEFTIALNGAKWDISHKYGMYFILTDPAGKAISDGKKEVFATVEVKNEYDGVYTVEAGNIQRYSAPDVPTVDDALNGDLAGNPDVSLSTINPTTVEIAGLTWHGGTSGVGGINNLRATIDPATNLVTMRALGNATLANKPGTENKYDPDTKTFTLNFWWNPTANKREVSIVLKYSRSR